MSCFSCICGDKAASLQYMCSLLGLPSSRRVGACSCAQQWERHVTTNLQQCGPLLQHCLVCGMLRQGVWRLQGSRVTRLVKTMMQPREGGSSGDKQPDVAAAAACLGVLVANQPLARGALLQQGALPALLTLLQEGSMAQQSVAANVLFDMTEGRLLHLQALNRSHTVPSTV